MQQSPQQSQHRTSTRPSTQPRWHSQSYMMFLALRQHPDRCLPRTQLIKAAIDLDKKISQERNLPKVFRGKTPMNSASAILTYNSDRYFVPFKPEGSRSTHFKLAYEPGNFKTAVQEYRKWEAKLAEHDWPFCFGELKEEFRNKAPSNPSEVNGEQPVEKVTTETANPAEESKTQLTTQPSMTMSESSGQMEAKVINSDRQDTVAIETENKPKDDTAAAPVSHDMPTLDQLDLTNVPKSWTDIVRVADSNIPGAGKGLFAKRRLPYNTPLGFYFGVPMTEDEFDSLKDGVGRASEYSIMYRKTVLDATDENGQPYSDPEGEMYCPFHFMNETNEAGANMWFLEGALVNQVICWTKRDIQEGEELLVWYGHDVDRYWSQSSKPTKSSTPSVRSPSSPSSPLASSSSSSTSPAALPPSTASQSPSVPDKIEPSS
ncbi:uncharacterized protein BYT42DRAFT_497308 [Radiomyces spectabilis]|uniref:uncharacterized protein n=1 Tax=Radiomyces spectabilis TaxID=64574 RepID=UPI0022206BCC|nr:uncharacterized protein BYT42DRAFT_497308 [Radiomyces spectabilis]KAI8377628.1 hypothetical protein BYT42DRAFT_497308 [Radiomyces spectabilis]